MGVVSDYLDDPPDYRSQDPQSRDQLECMSPQAHLTEAGSPELCHVRTSPLPDVLAQPDLPF